MKLARRALGGGLAAVVVALACAVPAGAAAPSVQVDDLGGGTAILGYDGTRARALDRFERSLRSTGVRTVFFQRLRLVAVRGNAVSLRRAARLRGVRSAHMDRKLQLFLHQSVPLVYGGTHETTWRGGVDGRGGAVAVVDSGVDGTHPGLQNRMSANVKVLDPGDIFDAGEPVYLECPVSCTTDVTGGHGTHVAGTVADEGRASNSFYRGVAPGSRLVGLSVGEGISVLYALGAFEWIMANHEKHGIVAVNNSWGPAGDDVRFDATDPINAATRALHRAGMVVVFAAGNSGTGARTSPEGGSDCGSRPADGGGREANDGACKINPYSVAPWSLSVANARKDEPGGPGGQHLNLSSSRGDPVPQQSLDGQTIDYMPTLSAPGTNIRAARALGGTTTPVACVSAETPSCVPPAGAEAYEPYYMPLSGTSMAAPHVAGAVAVIQSKARAAIGRRLTPDEVRQVLVESATPMTGRDGLWDWPCGSLPLFVECGERTAGTTGQPYARWQVGAGYLNVAGALSRVESLGGTAPSGGTTATGEAAPALPAGTAAAVRTTLPETAPVRQQRAKSRRAAKRRYVRCVRAARKKSSRRARARAKARCKRAYVRSVRR